MNKLLKLVNYFVTFILFTLLILTLYLVLSSKLIGKDMDLFNYQIKTVLSGSMEPDIQVGSIILVKTDPDPTQFQVDDIITFITEENVLVTHRITQIENDGQKYITKGDANDAIDMEPVLSENIVGKYNGFTLPYAGYILSFLSSKQGIAVLLIVPGVFFLIRSFIIFGQVINSIIQSKNKKEIDRE